MPIVTIMSFYLHFLIKRDNLGVGGKLSSPKLLGLKLVSPKALGLN
jgi:hypothetical protein